MWGTRSSWRRLPGLNESPSEKEGKFTVAYLAPPAITPASMKALPKRKGNFNQHSRALLEMRSLNESPSEKEGKS